jgi:CubicO group peptidase (beta-lactamase class C family)
MAAGLLKVLRIPAVLCFACGTFVPGPTASLQAQSPTAATVSTVHDSPAVVAGKAWLETNQIADDAAFEAALRNLWPTAPGTPDQWIQARAQFRTLQFGGVGELTAESAELWLFDPDMDRYLLATVTVRPDDSGKIAGIRIVPTDKVPDGVTPPPVLSPEELVAAVRTRAEERAAQGRFDGAVLIARDGRTPFQQAYGYADAEARRANTVETQFRFGSMGKMFTAVAIMQLIEADKIDPSAPIGRYLPGYANSTIADTVTVAHLLSHTGGTGDIFGPEFISRRSDLRDPADYVALFQDRAPEFEAGTRAAYSNYGFMLLGRIVETVSGSRYDDYVARHIWDPAGMASTGNQPESVTLPLRAVGYMGPPAALVRADDTLPYRGTPAGGGYSTVGDFLRFATALVDGKLVKPETLDMLVQGGVRLPDGHLIPYDFGSTMPGKGRWIGHGGAAPGMSGLLMHFLDSGYTVVALANRDTPASDAIVNFAARRLPANGD